jgi:hypothetical protein
VQIGAHQLGLAQLRQAGSARGDPGQEALGLVEVGEEGFAASATPGIGAGRLLRSWLIGSQLFSSPLLGSRLLGPHLGPSPISRRLGHLDPLALRLVVFVAHRESPPAIGRRTGGVRRDFTVFGVIAIRRELIV